MGLLTPEAKIICCRSSHSVGCESIFCNILKKIEIIIFHVFYYFDYASSARNSTRSLANPHRLWRHMRLFVRNKMWRDWIEWLQFDARMLAMPLRGLYLGSQSYFILLSLPLSSTRRVAFMRFVRCAKHGDIWLHSRKQYTEQHGTHVAVLRQCMCF